MAKCRTASALSRIEPLIRTIRGQKVILDSDLARIYGVTTKRLNEQVRRNAKRFPEDFAFQLTREEFESLRSQFAISNLKSQIATSSWEHGGRRKLPYAFTEYGAIMAANVLNSAKAVAMSLYVIRAFIRMREELMTNLAFAKRLAEIERILLDHDITLRDIIQKIRPLLLPPSESSRPKIGFVRERKSRYFYAPRRIVSLPKPR